MKNDCVFCAIDAGEIKSEKLYEDENCFIIKDLHPVCKYHYLLIPKDHYVGLAEADAHRIEVLGKCLSVLPKLSEKLHLENGYRLVINQGDDAGQTVKHLHIHVLAGQKMGFSV